MPIPHHSFRRILPGYHNGPGENTVYRISPQSRQRRGGECASEAFSKFPTSASKETRKKILLMNRKASTRPFAHRVPRLARPRAHAGLAWQGRCVSRRSIQNLGWNPMGVETRCPAPLHAHHVCTGPLLSLAPENQVGGITHLPFRSRSFERPSHGCRHVGVSRLNRHSISSLGSHAVMIAAPYRIGNAK